MPDSTLLQLIIPLVLAAGGVFGWLAARSRRNDSKPIWRDNSLDDWRREREEQHDQERVERDDRLADGH